MIIFVEKTTSLFYFFKNLTNLYTKTTTRTNINNKMNTLFNDINDIYPLLYVLMPSNFTIN